jgi:hypothetical protein
MDPGKIMLRTIIASVLLFLLCGVRLSLRTPRCRTWSTLVQHARETAMTQRTTSQSCAAQPCRTPTISLVLARLTVHCLTCLQSSMEAILNAVDCPVTGLMSTVVP